MGVAQWNGQQGACTLNYKRTATKDRVNFGTEIQIAPPTMDTAIALGSEFNLKQSKISTVIDGRGTIKTVVETKLNPAAALTFSADIDHSKEQFKFGYGLTVGG